MAQDNTTAPIQSQEAAARKAQMKGIIRECIAQAYTPGRMKPLRREMRRAMRRIRRAYAAAVREGQGGFGEWLGDNYHLLVREGEAVLAGLRFAGMQPCEEGMPATFRLFVRLFDEQGLPDDEELEEILAAAAEMRPLTVFELAQLPLCLRAALIVLAAKACEEKGAEAERLIALAVTGLRQAGEWDFSGLTERYSIVERILSSDPAGIYPRMDEESRENYRRRVAWQALREDISEAAVAARLVEAAEQGETPRERHVGTALLAAGGRRRRARGRTILLCSALLPVLLSIALAVWAGNPWTLLLFYLPAWEFLRPVIEYFGMKGIVPKSLPRLELEGVVPEEGRTAIVVSALLPSADRAEQTARHLAHLYNTNGQGAVQICLLADLKQADFPEMPQDASDIAAMMREVRRLNRRFGDAFVLAVRPREFSPTMQSYTGRERKRGAITQLARAMRGGDASFLAFEGDMQALQRCQFILALDADTGMLLDTAARLVGTALHPCNRPEVDRERRRVVRGYGVLTPRIGVALDSANRTAFSRSMAGVGGITPYDVSAGELYMDCFGSGIFAGKGLLDVDALLAVTENVFPPEQVLSHDILEGCLLRAGFVSDVEMTDGFPSAMGGWLDRLHRWIRGDWQNMPFLFSRRLPFERLDRWKLLDNLRRSVTPAAALLCLLFSPFMGGAGLPLALAGVLAPVSGQLFAAVLSLVHGGWQTLSGRYYSRVMPRAMSAVIQGLFNLVMLPAAAVTGVSAALTALWRLRSRRRMLEWVTAAESERRKNGWTDAFMRLWPSLAAAAVTIVWGGGLTRLAGLFFLALIPLAVLSARPGRRPEKAGHPLLSATARERVGAYAAAMWRYYEEQCTQEEHYLPPDNLQESPVWRVARRTSPTNIGLYLLCILAARDFGLIDGEGVLLRVGRTLSTVERLEKWHGNLLNWYDTRTLRPLSPRYVSTVDSGNFACCLTALRQGLLELREPGATELAERAARLNAALELTPLYNRRRGLFHIGLNPDTGEHSPSYYDLLMSESRMTGYYAIATRQVPKKHWGMLGRMLARAGGYVGPVSWTGTMFEYFMPRLLLPAQEGSMSYEALRFCLHCQRRRPPRGVPWGISESGFYAFDGNLNYQYKAHGVPKLGLKRGLAADMVISPYSSFLALGTDPDAALRNLARLERLGMTGRCGFYEAADFTPGRAARGGYSVVRSYMAHHVGMSLIACANAAFGDVFVSRFMRDGDMARAAELLDEKAPAFGSVYDSVAERAVPELPGRSHPATEEIRTINPRTPHVHLLSGGEWMLAVTDAGAGISRSRGLDIHMFSDDLLRRPQGIFTLVDAGEGAFSLTRAPDYGEDEETYGHRAEFGPGFAAFYAHKGSLEAGLRIMVHPRLPSEQRQLVLQNKSSRRVTARVLFYFEPCLARREDAQAHPAFSRLFLSARKDDTVRALFVTRRQRGAEAPVCLAAGLLDAANFEYEASREALLTRPLGVQSLPQAVDAPFSSKGHGVPDSAVAIRLSMEIPARSQRSITLILTAAPTEAEASARMIEARREGLLTEARAAQSPFGGVEAQLAVQVVPDLLYPPRMSREWAQAARENTRGQSALWALGISGDDPILLIEVHNAADASRAEPYMRLHRSLRLGGVAAELAVVYREGGAYDAPILQALREAARAVRCEGMIGARGGIHMINLDVHGEQALSLLTAVCAHNGARDLQRTGLPPAGYTPADILPVEKSDIIQKEDESLLNTEKGVFTGHSFRVTDDPRLPWCHVLSNPVFGTLVSDKALGFTWAVNARENKLTPWFNDTASDNRGEMLLLKAGGKIYDTVWGAQADFDGDAAHYTGRAAGIETTVTVRVADKGMFKQVELTLVNHGGEEQDVQAAYYIEPVLGVNRRNARHTVARWENGALLLRNPFSAVGGCLILTVQGGADGCDCDRGAFLSGAWGGGTLSPLPDPCAAVIVRRKLPPKGRESVRFLLGFAARDTAALRYPALAWKQAAHTAAAPCPRTPDRALDLLCAWLPRQILACRINARTGFYQCGGAWGFRDQLQDSLAAMWLDPAVTRRQLLRCAAAQFEEGDVLHWWHALTGAPPRGVRTRCSDDLIWLPFAAAEYAVFTGDAAIWETRVRWLSGAPLAQEEQERYFEPGRTPHADTMYEHCARALDRAMTAGDHGLPLIGSGDWNDGFNRVGEQGRGESVWLAMFLCMTLERFAPLCARRGDEGRAQRYLAAAQGYRQAADACFDGDRFLRAYLDDGTPLGKAGADACALDSLTQSFAVLCGLPPDKTGPALDTALRELTDRRSGIIKLFTPPFDHNERRVGYIASYPPGVRENGGQYTHAAVWLAIALLEAGRADEGVQALRLLNPAAKYEDGRGAAYLGEPYALAGDVYAGHDCPGRVGWTWYTGSAGWYYTAVLRHLFGLRPMGERLELSPRLPADWPGCELTITLRATPLVIRVCRGAPGLTVDGVPASWVPLDGSPHHVEISAGGAPSPQEN